MVIEAIVKVQQFAGPTLDACLCALMLTKGRWRGFPAFFSLVFLDLLSSIALYWIDPTGLSVTYMRAYVAFDIASFVLQLLVLYEIAKNVLKPAGIWEGEAIRPLLLITVIGAAIAFAATLLLQPRGISGPALIQLRADVFTGLLTCEAVISMMLAASHVGLAWRSHSMAIGQGLMIWSLVLASIDGFAVYLGPHSPYYNALYYVRSINYLVVVGYWTVSLWYEEPARKPISPALRKYIVALHERVQYDLGKAGH